jgi:hypothetical protein
MSNLALRTWVCNAAAVFSGQYGSVTQQAKQSQCSRETVYQHARKVEERLAEVSSDKSRLAEQEVEIQRLQGKVAELEARAQQPIALEPIKQRKFATVASALGLSLRQTEDLFKILLPPGQAPHRSTIGRWVKAEEKWAGEVLKVLDQKCATKVRTLALDEIFFGGDQP